ncbi:MAG TPA: SGNH/GDSL hydrolase family protein [Polyangia bacterium]|nr:SGNH/GDSL hydrolase family protein [Polyangia bacterium]
MAQPQPYSPSHDFLPGTNIGHVPGQELNVEFNALKTTLDQTLSNLRSIQRDDGAVQNGAIDTPQLSPTLSQLMTQAAAIIATSTGPRGPAGPPGSNSAYITNGTPANLKQTAAAINSMFNATPAFPRMHLYGDSLTKGSGGLIQKYSPGQRMADELTRRGINSINTIFGFDFGTTAELTAWEPRLVFTGSWGQWTQMPGGKTFLCSSNAGTMTYTPGYSHDIIDVYWYRGSDNGAVGSMTLTLGDGGTFNWATFLASGGGSIASGSGVTTVTISQAGVTNWMRTRIMRNAAATSSLIITNGATNKIEIAGIEPFLSTASTMLIRSMGATGQPTTYLVATSSRTFILGVPCEIAVLCIGRNDLSNGVNLGTYATNLATIRGDMVAALSQDAIFWTWPPSALSDTSKVNQQAYTDAMRTAAGTNTVLADLWQRYEDLGGQEALASGAANWYNDGLHPNAFGNYDIAEFLVRTLLRNNI